MYYVYKYVQYFLAFSLLYRELLTGLVYGLLVHVLLLPTHTLHAWIFFSAVRIQIFLINIAVFSVKHKAGTGKTGGKWIACNANKRIALSILKLYVMHRFEFKLKLD